MRLKASWMERVCLKKLATFKLKVSASVALKDSSTGSTLLSQQHRSKKKISYKKTGILGRLEFANSVKRTGFVRFFQAAKLRLQVTKN